MPKHILDYHEQNHLLSLDNLNIILGSDMENHIQSWEVKACHDSEHCDKIYKRRSSLQHYITTEYSNLLLKNQTSIWKFRLKDWSMYRPTYIFQKTFCRRKPYYSMGM